MKRESPRDWGASLSATRQRWTAQGMACRGSGSARLELPQIGASGMHSSGPGPNSYSGPALWARLVLWTRQRTGGNGEAASARPSEPPVLSRYLIYSGCMCLQPHRTLDVFWWAAKPIPAGWHLARGRHHRCHDDVTSAGFRPTTAHATTHHTAELSYHCSRLHGVYYFNRIAYPTMYRQFPSKCTSLCGFPRMLSIICHIGWLLYATQHKCNAYAVISRKSSSKTKSCVVIVTLITSPPSSLRHVPRPTPLLARPARRNLSTHSRVPCPDPCRSVRPTRSPLVALRCPGGLGKAHRFQLPLRIVGTSVPE